jgi:serine phosphatase RsbU (regulator of sigma subunit)
MAISANINRSIIFSSVLIFAGARLIGDSLLFIMKKLDSDTIFIWKTVSALALVFSLMAYLFYEYIKTGAFSEKNLKDSYFKDISKLMVTSVVLLLIKFFLPETVSAYLLEKSILHLIFSDIVTILYMYAAVLTFYNLYKWAFIRKHKKTRILIRSVIVLYAFIFVMEYVNVYADSNFINIAKIITLISTFVLMKMLFSNNSWMTTLTRKKKIQLLWMSFFSAVLMIILCYYSLNDDTNLHSSLMYFMGGASLVTGYPFFCGAVYFTKMFFSTIGALPTSEIMDRRSYEIQSLTYLNKIIADAVEFENLLKTVASLALSSTGATFSWIELFKADNSIDKIYSENINPEDVLVMRSDEELNKVMISIDNALLIESIPEEVKYGTVFTKINFANSLIIIPLYYKSKKIGNLLVASKEEYGLDTDDISVLNAFRDNVSIAIENAKLLEDSIEKEKYKQEIALAKNMQDKLLPRKVPVTPDYSIAAFSRSAEVVGGDYYDFLELKNGKTCILIGDVSGKGITASFYMAQLKGVAMSVAKEAETAAEMLKKINATLYRKMDRQMYITLSAVVLDGADGAISFARAGHMPTVIKTNNGIAFHTPKGFGIGLASSKLFDVSIEEMSVKLNKNDVCFLFTDGVNELRNPNGEDFGYDSLKQILSSRVYESADAIVNSFLDNLDVYLGDAKQLDDITIVAFQKKND